MAVAFSSPATPCAAAGSCPWRCHALSRINEHMPPGTAGVYLALLPINPATEKSGRSAPHWLRPRLRPFMPPHASKAGAAAPVLSQEERSRLTPTPPHSPTPPSSQICRVRHLLDEAPIMRGLFTRRGAGSQRRRRRHVIAARRRRPFENATSQECEMSV